MKAIEQIRIHTIAAWRAHRAGRGGEPLPADLVLRLDGFDAPDIEPVPTLKLEEWYERIIGVLVETGPLPVRVIARADNPLLAEVVRFVWRLECPATVRMGGRVGRGVAEALVDAGARRIVLVDPVDSDLAELRAARISRKARVDLLVEVGYRRGLSVAGEGARLRAAGADGVRVGAPWRGGPFEPVAAWEASFHRTPPTVLHALPRFDDDGPGVPRTRGVCPVGGLRVELGPDGRWSQCPFQPGHVEGGEFAVAWAALGAHRAAIRACSRACVHAELAPGDPGAGP